MAGATGRLAGVSAVVLAAGGGDRATALAARLGRWLEDVRIAACDPDPDPRAALPKVADALRAARGERVLLVSAELPVAPELALALVAWPVADAVVARDAAGRRQPLCGVYRRAPALAAADAQIAADQPGLDGWLDALDARALPADVMADLDPEAPAATPGARG